jgi:glycosyltransferase involved in cell wall biosynthesis
MHILHVVPTYLPATRYGGPIVAVHNLCRALAARGHQVEVFTTSIDGPTDSAVRYDAPVMLDGVAVRYFASRWLRRLARAPAMIAPLRRAVADADVVHLHSVFLWPTWRAARMAQRAGIPYVISPRGMLVKKLIDSRNRAIKSAWITLIERSSLERAAAVHATSTLEAEEIQKFGFGLRQVAMVPNGVEDSVTERHGGLPSPDIAALGREQPLILYFGRLARVKALDRLLQGFAQTRRGILAIVGTDYEGLAPELVRLARRLNVDHRFRLVPRSVTGADKDSAFAAAQVFVLASHSESFGNTVLEALLRGVPVIVTPEVGAAEVVRESAGGLVVDGDPTSLGRAMDWLTEDPARASAMGEAGRRHVGNHYSWQSVAARMEMLYQGLCAAR